VLIQQPRQNSEKKPFCLILPNDKGALPQGKNGEAMTIFVTGKKNGGNVTYSGTGKIWRVLHPAVEHWVKQKQPNTKTQKKQQTKNRETT